MVSTLTATFYAILHATQLALGRPTSTECHPHWVNLTSLPSPRQEHGTVTIDDSIIAVVGGVTLPPGANITNTTDLMQFYDIDLDTWTTKPPTPIKINHPNVAVFDGKIYLLGGLTDSKDPVVRQQVTGWDATGFSSLFDPSNETWSPLPSMPAGMERGSAITGVHGEMIYLAGGMTILHDDYEDVIDTVIAFNTTSKSWQRVPPAAAIMPHGREHAAGGVIGDILYVVGGRTFSQFDTRNTTFTLDLTDLNAGWKSLQHRMLVPQGGLSGGSVGDMFFAFGGEGDPTTITGVSNHTEVLDTVTGKWRSLQPMPVPRHGTHASSARGVVYVPGGGLQQDGKPVNLTGTVRIENPTAHFDALIAC